jgi:hypothetical protein
MNKLDQSYEEIMKGIRIDSPSRDFTLKVMSRIQAEVAVRQKPLLSNYEPVISRKVWIGMALIFFVFLAYLISSGTNASASGSIWNELLYSLSGTHETSLWRKGFGALSTVPVIVYLILASTMALWTMDMLLNQFKHKSQKQ